MNKSEVHRHGIENPYNWQGVMEFLYNEYQQTSQKQNIWALERNALNQNIRELQGKILALENINRQLKNRNNILEHSLRQIKIKSHEKKNKENESIEQSNNFSISQQMQQLPKVPQRRPKPNRANLSKQILIQKRMLCSLGIPQLLEDIKKDLQHSPSQNIANPKPEGKKGFQLDLSKMEADTTKHTQNMDRKLSYEIAATLQGHQDGVREAVFLNYNNELKQIVSASEDSTLKVWEVKRNSIGKIQKGECIETIRDHSGPIFTCVQGDGYLFTGGMEGIIRAYNFSQYTRDKRQLMMKWKTDDEEEKLEPLWQLVYDKQNKFLIATASEMAIKGYKIPSIQQEKSSSNLRIKPYCQFLYHPKNSSSEQYEEFIPTAVCLSNSALVASYFNTSSLVHYDLETQQILNEINYQIDSNLSANKLVSHPKFVIGAYQDTFVRIFDSHKMIDSFKAHNQPVMGVSLHSNHPNSLFTCSQDGLVRLWDLRKLKEHLWETVGHQKKNDEAVHFIQTNFDGVTVSGGADSILKVYTPIN